MSEDFATILAKAGEDGQGPILVCRTDGLWDAHLLFNDERASLLVEGERRPETALRRVLQKVKK